MSAGDPIEHRPTYALPCEGAERRAVVRFRPVLGRGRNERGAAFSGEIFEEERGRELAMETAGNLVDEPQMLSNQIIAAA